MEPAPVPAIITNETALLEAALRWCAAAGTTADVAHDLTSARALWRRASVILVGADLVPALASAGLLRRDRVAVIATEDGPPWAQAVSLGVEAAFTVPSDEPEVLSWLAAQLDGHGEACVVSILGGSGGVGASTLAAALCTHAARRDLSTMLLDVDPWAGGAELLLGRTLQHGLTWSELAGTSGHITSATLTDVLPRARGVAALSWPSTGRPAVPTSLLSVLGSAERAFDLVVADLPRRGVEAVPDALARSALTVLVVAEEVRALAAARHSIEFIRESASAVAVVSVMRSRGTGARVVAEVLEAPVLARVRHDRSVRAEVDAGSGPANLALSSRRQARSSTP